MSQHLTTTLLSARKTRRISQWELAERLNISQRHVSFVETGRSRPSRELLIQWLQALQVPMEQRNAVFLQAGFAPYYRQTGLDAPEMAIARDALARLLERHAPYPALLFDTHWNVLHFNKGGTWLARLLFPWALELPAGVPFNMLDALVHPEGIAAQLSNIDEVGPSILLRLRDETAMQPELVPKVDRFEALLTSRLGERRMKSALMDASRSPLLCNRFTTTEGDFSLFSLYTTFGMPQDITLSSIRLEYLFPGDEATRVWIERSVEA